MLFKLNMMTDPKQMLNLMAPSYKTSNPHDFKAELKREAIVDQFFRRTSNQDNVESDLEIQEKKSLKKSSVAKTRNQLPRLYNKELYQRYTNRLSEKEFNWNLWNLEYL